MQIGRVNRWLFGLLGCGSWITVAAGLLLMAMAARANGGTIIMIVLLGAAGTLALGVYLSDEWNWRGIVPGVVIGMALSVLVPPVAVYVICAMH